MNKLLNNTFFKRVSILAAGSVLAQLVTIASTPFITRVYSPDTYGIFSTIIAVVITLGPIATLSYPLAIQLAKENIESEQLFKLSLWCACLTSSFVLVIISALTLQQLNLSILITQHYLFFIPLGILIFGITQSTRQYLIRNRNYSRIANAEFSSSVLSAIVKLLGGLIYASPVVLIVGLLVGKTLELALHFHVLFRRNNKSVLVKWPDRGSWVLAKKYFEFPLYETPVAVLNAGCIHLPLFIFIAFGEVAAAGYYALSRAMVMMPVRLIGIAIRQTFYAVACERRIQGQSIGPLLYKSIFGTLLVALPSMCLLFYFAPNLFSFVFGKDWEIAGEYARWLGILTGLYFCSITSRASAPILKLQGINLALEVVSNMSATLLLIWMYLKTDNTILAVAAYAIVIGSFQLVLMANTARKAMMRAS